MAENKKNDVYSRFNFCGKVSVSRKAPMVKRDTYGASEKIGINFGIKAGTNMGYVKLEGFKNDTVKTRDVDGNNIEVDWADRFDEEVVKNVASIKKFTVNLGERKEFITEWDMIEYLAALRCRQAAQLLLESDMTMLDISLGVGFECLRTFYRAFKSCYDMTPSQYIKAHTRE